MAIFTPRRLAIDLGTTNTIIWLPKKGIVVSEPSVVAINAQDNSIVTIGREAREMLGRTPESIIAAHPIRDGVIANYRICEAMLRYFLNRVLGPVRLVRPDIMVAIPAGVTSTERRAVVDATVASGAREAYLIKEPIAAALGAGIPIATPSGNLIIDIGGGTCEVAVIALGDIVASSSIRVGGVKFDQAIQAYIRKKYNVTCGEATAEQIKIHIGAAMPLEKNLTMEISGSNTVTGLPETIVVSSEDVVAALKDELSQIIGAVKAVLQKTPPELASDVIDKGAVMTGGGSLLRRLDDLLAKVTGIPVQVIEEPHLATVRGAGIACEHLDTYKRSILWAKGQ